jgi:glycerol-3-phosphate cytidylyltransferase
MVLKKRKIKIGYTTGVFDLFHVGHLNILRRAKSMCDELIVGVATDELTKKLKGKKPIISLKERMLIVKNIQYVDQVVPQKKIDEIGDCDRLKFELIFKGDDWKGTDKWNNLEREFKKKGVRVVYFKYTKKTSSSLIRKTLKEEIKN